MFTVIDLIQAGICIAVLEMFLNEKQRTGNKKCKYLSNKNMRLLTRQL